MVRTRVGYAGGTTENPTYSDVGDHSETVQIDFDPTVISYQKLLDIFWNSHNCTVQSWSRQYASIIFYHDAEQERLARATLARQEAQWGKIYTEIVPYTRFYLAEDYHQKYYLRGEERLFREVAAIYPTTEQLIASTAVARINGYVGHHGSCETLRQELPLLGLSAEGGRWLERIVCGSSTR